MRRALFCVLILAATQSPSVGGEPIVADEPVVGNEPLFDDQPPFADANLPGAQAFAGPKRPGSKIRPAEKKPSTDGVKAPGKPLLEIELPAVKGVNESERCSYHGMTWLTSHEYDDAVDCFTKAIQLDRYSAAAYVGRAAAWTGKKELDRAVDDFDQALRLKPDDAQLHLMRGSCLIELKDYDLALDDMNAAIRLAPNDAAARLARGKVWSRKRDQDQAIEDFNEALRLDPNNADAWLWRGAAWYRLHDYGQALADFEEAIHRDPSSIRSYQLAAWTLATCPDERSRDGRRAVELAARGCELGERSSADVYITLGAAYAECGDFETAILCQDKALDLNPGLDDVLRGLKAAALYRRGLPFRER